MSAALRVLALAAYPDRAAATRHRVMQYVPLLAERGVQMDVRPFISNRVFSGMYERSRALITAAGVAAGAARRLADVLRLDRYDLVFLQREAALVGPPVVEWLAQRKRPLVLDLDDSTYIDRRSEIFGKLAALRKWPHKTDRLIGWSEHVVCGNPTIAAYVQARGRASTVLPTIVDVDRWTPRARREDGDLVVGWIGTHSTFSYFRTLIPVFRRLAATHRFRVRVVGAQADLKLDGVPFESLRWTLEREIDDLRSFDVAVYPIVPDAWAEGKSGFKAVQYLSCGIPYVATPVGVVGQIGIPGRTHFEATSEDEWVAALSRLLDDAGLRARMGAAAREYAVRHFSIRDAAATLEAVFRAAAGTPAGGS